MAFQKNQIVVVSDVVNKRFVETITKVTYADEEKIVVELNGQQIIF
jgi:hypothetical protein